MRASGKYPRDRWTESGARNGTKWPEHEIIIGYSIDKGRMIESREGGYSKVRNPGALFRQNSDGENPAGLNIRRAGSDPGNSAGEISIMKSARKALFIRENIDIRDFTR
jgi:hypothetical protein